MKYTTITYSRNQNLGNYESHKMELTIELEEGDNLELVAEILKEKVHSLLTKNQLAEDASFAHEQLPY